MKVDRMTPVTTLPYNFFSPHAPYFSITRWSGSDRSVNGNFSFPGELGEFLRGIGGDADDLPVSGVGEDRQVVPEVAGLGECSRGSWRRG